MSLFFRQTTFVNWMMFLLPLFFLTIKGWTNVIALCLSGFSIFCIVRSPGFYLSGRGKRFWFIVVSLASPFIAEVIAQLGRYQFSAPGLDGPARFLLASTVFVFLSKCEGLNVDLFRFKAVSISICLVCISVLLFRDQWWTPTRASTYFVDPISMSAYLVALLGLLLPFFLTQIGKQKHQFVLLTAQLVLIILVLLILMLSRSRTAWLSFLCLGLAWIVFCFKKGGSKFLLQTLFFSSAICLFLFSDLVSNRIAESIAEIRRFYDGDYANSSIGGRFGLANIDIALIKMSPWFGLQDGNLPPFAEIRGYFLKVTQSDYVLRGATGSHNEALAQLSGRGVFGLFSYVSVVLVPLIYFGRRSIGRGENREIFASAFLFVLVVAIAGLTIQTFNLKMMSTFYSMVLAYFFSIANSETKV